jgi:hypothetical protein
MTSIVYDIIKAVNQNDKYEIMMEWQYEVD